VNSKTPTREATFFSQKRFVEADAGAEHEAAFTRIQLSASGRIGAALTIKSLAKGLTPPLIWESVRRTVSARQKEPVAVRGFERPNSWYDRAYANDQTYLCHYADSVYYAIWCVLVDRVQPKTVGCILDIGCGPGQLACFLRDKGLRRYVGLDFSQECIRMARRTCSSFEFVRDSALSSDVFEKLDYDVVLTTEFLEHVEEDLAIIDRIRPGTRVYATVPNFPYESHVRYFRSVEEVAARYSSRLDNFKADQFLHGSQGMAIFLFQGIRTLHNS
jgi:2-polyprenyl-3-methyl-5-hydroxy-6-metoxy-1,4-benzoquinol methylase